MPTNSRLLRIAGVCVLAAFGVVGVVGLAIRWPERFGALALLAALLWLCREAYKSSFSPKELVLSDEAEIELRRKLLELAKRKRRNVA